MEEQVPLKTVGQVNLDLINQITVDYIVNNLSIVDLCKKYNVNKDSLFKIRHRMEFDKKRESYKKLVLQKAIDKLATKQSAILVKTIDIMLNHINGIAQKQKLTPDGVLPSAIVKDILSIHEIFLKEKRLNEDKPTDNIGLKVVVEMPNIPIIGHSTNIQDAEVIEEPKQISATPIEIKTEQIEEKIENKVIIEDNVEVKIDGDILGIL